MIQVADPMFRESHRVGRKKPGIKPIERARDKGTVTGLGVEVTIAINDALERCRVAKKWSKRTLVEEALTRYLTAEGFPPVGE